MKKWYIIMLASAMVLALSLPATADVEHQFGGYFRVRAFTNQNFTGEDATEAQDLTVTDTRTRLYYTAQFSDVFKFVNKFELDADFGDGGAEYGDLGADGIGVEVKNSYIDFTLGSVRSQLGVFGSPKIARGFVFDSDMSGAHVTYSTDAFTLPFLWAKAAEGGSGLNANDFDVDIYAINPSFKVSDAISLNPFFLWWFSDDASQFNAAWDDLSTFFIGANADLKMDPFSLWFTAAFQGGEIDMVATGLTNDVSAFLVAGGGSTSIGPVGIHSQAFFASGDDDLADDEIESFTVPGGNSYYWAEIMGAGAFDDQVSNGSPGSNPSNILAGNIGVTYSPMEKVKLKGDLWAASLPEDTAAGEDYLGTELDLKVTYAVLPGLNLDLIGAYLFAGDATEAAADSADPYELGAQISVSW